MQSIYKGILMVGSIDASGSAPSLFQVIGSRFAWATRNVRITALNDSTYVGMSLYNVVLLSITTAVVGYFLRDQHERSYILTSTFILLCVTITLCLVFVPKIRAVTEDPQSNAKRERAVIPVPNAVKSTRSDEMEKAPLKPPNEQISAQISQLTQLNQMLKVNAMKVNESAGKGPGISNQ